MMTRLFVFCLTAFAAASCRGGDGLEVLPASPTHVEIMLDDGRHQIAYDLPDASWTRSEGPAVIGAPALGYTSGTRSIDIAFSQDDDFQHQADAVSRLSDALEGACGIDEKNVDYNRRRVDLRATCAPFGGEATSAVVVTLRRLHSFPTVYVMIAARIPTGEPFDLEAFATTVNVGRR